MNKKFKRQIDQIVELAEFDQELKDGITWLDKYEKLGTNLDFYEKAYKILLKYEINSKAKAWMLTKNETKTNQET